MLRQSHSLDISGISKSDETLSHYHQLNISPLSKSVRQSHTLNVSKITKSVETLSQSHNLNISPLSKSVETVSPDQQVPDAAGDVKRRSFAEQGHHLREKIKRKLK